MRVWLPLGLLILAAAGCGPQPDPVVNETRALEDAWVAIRESILQADDEAFFEMHSEAARAEAVELFPAVRARYLGSPEEERAAFRGLFHVTEQEFLHGTPRDLVVKMMPWKSGWRMRREIFRTARVRDVRINEIEHADGSSGLEGVVVLDISASVDPAERGKIPNSYLPTVVFVKGPEGWRRKAFLASSKGTIAPEKSQEGD